MARFTSADDTYNNKSLHTNSADDSQTKNVHVPYKLKKKKKKKKIELFTRLL